MKLIKPLTALAVLLLALPASADWKTASSKNQDGSPIDIIYTSSTTNDAQIAFLCFGDNQGVVVKSPKLTGSGTSNGVALSGKTSLSGLTFMSAPGSASLEKDEAQRLIDVSTKSDVLGVAIGKEAPAFTFATKDAKFQILNFKTACNTRMAEARHKG